MVTLTVRIWDDNLTVIPPGNAFLILKSAICCRADAGEQCSSVKMSIF